MCAIIPTVGAAATDSLVASSSCVQFPHIQPTVPSLLIASSFYIYPLPPLDKPHFERYPTAKSCAVACCGNTPDCFLSFCCLSLTLFFFLSPPQCSSEIMRQTAPPLLQLLLPPLCILILATLFVPVASDDADFGEVEEEAVVEERIPPPCSTGHYYMSPPSEECGGCNNHKYCCPSDQPEECREIEEISGGRCRPCQNPEFGSQGTYCAGRRRERRQLPTSGRYVGNSSQQQHARLHTNKSNARNNYASRKHGSKRAASSSHAQSRARRAPVFADGDSASASPNEAQTAVGRYAATDSDGASLTYSIVSSSDNAASVDHDLFTVASGGVLSFASAPDYETPGCGAENNLNTCVVVIKAGSVDGARAATIKVSVAVQDVNEDLATPTIDGYALINAGAYTGPSVQGGQGCFEFTAGYQCLLAPSEGGPSNDDIVCSFAPLLGGHFDSSYTIQEIFRGRGNEPTQDKCTFVMTCRRSPSSTESTEDPVLGVHFGETYSSTGPYSSSDATGPLGDHQLHFYDQGLLDAKGRLNFDGSQLDFGEGDTAHTCKAVVTPTATELLADVSDTTLADSTFWERLCGSIPGDALFIKVVMGTVVDYFRPYGEGVTFCDMLVSTAKHSWSRDGTAWADLTQDSRNSDQSTDQPLIYGSSTKGWPADYVESNGGNVEDRRLYLSAWGHGFIKEGDASDEQESSPGYGLGGCCSSSYSNTAAEWGRSKILLSNQESARGYGWIASPPLEGRATQSISALSMR